MEDHIDWDELINLSLGPTLDRQKPLYSKRQLCNGVIFIIYIYLLCITQMYNNNNSTWSDTSGCISNASVYLLT